MSDRTVFADFFEDFVPPHDMRLMLREVYITGGMLDQEKRAMELNMETDGEFPQAAQEALRQLLMRHYDLRSLRLSVQENTKKAEKTEEQVVMVILR